MPQKSDKKSLPLWYKAEIPVRLLEEAMSRCLPEPLPDGEVLRLTDVHCDHKGGVPVVIAYARRWSNIVDGPRG